MKGDMLVSFDKVTKSFGNDIVLDDLSIQFIEGETHIICGRSGAGKSTLIRCINYLEKIDSGGIYFRDLAVNIKNAKEIRKKISMVFQEFNLFPHMTILENAVLGPVNTLKEPKNKAEKRAVELFEQVGLKEKIDSYPYQLSGGQKQRAAIVRALNMNPDLMLFDEPTSALDPETIGEVTEVIKGLIKGGRSMIIVTHEMNFALESSDKISFLEEGKILLTKPSKEFFQDPVHDNIRQFLRQILGTKKEDEETV
ncbi:polar amino acid ABC transporter ATP-binding protein [Candidatus Atribacteria bacterium HGW-Atribacteria-1]|nr:MAG: polar amino acid ABC transporter ATP-binding protein [Candidatus Atribacteria bacterium HGW-Atribacteria-1]